MKKVLSLILLLILTLVGLNYLTSNKAQEIFENTTSALNNLENLKVVNKTYQKGFLSSKASFELVHGDKTFSENDIVVIVDGEIKSDIFTMLLNGTMAKFDIKAKNSEISQFVGALFKSDSFMQIEAKSGFDGSLHTRVNLKPFSFNDNQNRFESNGAWLDISIDKNYFIKNVKVNLDDLLAYMSGFKIDLKSLNSNTDLDENISFESFLSKPFIGKSSGVIKMLKVSLEDTIVILNDFKYNGVSNQKDNLIFGSDVTNISELIINNMLFKDIVLKSKLDNFNIDAANNIANSISTFYNYNLLESTLNESIPKIINSNPAYSLNLSAKNHQNHMLNADINFSIVGADKINSGNFYAKTAEFLNFNGYFKFSPSFESFLSQMPKAQAFKFMFINNGLLKQDSGFDKLEFKFDKDKKDVVINENIFLKDFFK